MHACMIEYRVFGCAYMHWSFGRCKSYTLDETCRWARREKYRRAQMSMMQKGEKQGGQHVLDHVEEYLTFGCNVQPHCSMAESGNTASDASLR